ncbi:SMR family transporter [Streptosporangium lutulentum]
MTAAWWFLTGAIVVEVASTSALKIASDGGGAPGWYVVPSLVGLVISYLLMSQSMSMGLKISVAYAVWSGLGTAAIAVIGAAFFGESLTPVKIVSIAVIIAGVVGLNLAPSSAPSPLRLARAQPSSWTQPAERPPIWSMRSVTSVRRCEQRILHLRAHRRLPYATTVADASCPSWPMMRRSGLALTVSITGQGAVLGDVVAITQGLPRMIAELQPAQEFQLAASWIGLAYIAGFVVMLAMHRRLLAVSDKRMVLGCALTVFAVGAAVAVAAPTWTILLTARAFQGGSAAIVVTACLPVLLSQLVDRQVQMLPLWAASTTIGALFIHAAGAWLVHTAGWRALLAPGLITATVTIFMLAAVPRPRRGKHLSRPPRTIRMLTP